MKRNRFLIFLLVIMLLLAGSGAAIWYAIANMNWGLDLRGGVYVLYQAQEMAEGAGTGDKLERAITIIDSRINALGVAEPVIQREGADRIRVELPGISDQQMARQVIGKTALLQFIGPDGEVIVQGDELKNAYAVYDQYNRPAVALEFNAEGTRKFAEATKELVGQQIFIHLDAEIISAPVVTTAITDGKAIIEGVGTLEEAGTLALQLRSGALPVQLEELEIRGVGPQLGRDSLNRSVRAGVAGLVLVILFMLIFYRGYGLMANIALIVYSAMVLAVLSALKVTLTFPGIAGLILSLGMAVDANIVIFECIKEEIQNGHTARTAIEIGFNKAFRAILDSNVTTLIAAAVLFYFATGPVRGFAVTLSIGILASMFTAVVLTRYLLRLAAGSVLLKWPQTNQRSESSKATTKLRRYARGAVVFSLLLILVGVGALFLQGLNYSIDFTGGTIIQLDLGRPFTLAEVRETLEPFNLEGSTLQKVTADNISEEEAHEVIIKTRELSAQEQDKLLAAFKERFAFTEDAVLRLDKVGAVVGSELQRQALIALILASIGMIIYITIRFEFRFAVTAMAALLHDAFIIITFFSLFGWKVNSTFIAAILTIVGYSINDTIVIYDRIRENLKLKRKETLAEIVYNSIRQSLTRCINTSVTTLLVLLTLLFFGGLTIRPFIVALVIGVVAGTYSSILLAGTLWLWWKERHEKKIAMKNA